MRLGLKLLMMLFWFVELSAVSIAQSTKDEDGQRVMEKLYGEIEVSCETLVIVEYEGSLYEGVNPKIIPFAKNVCQKLLPTSDMQAYLGPLFQFYSSIATPDPDQSSSESDLDREKRVAEEELQFRLMHKKLQSSTMLLTEICRTLGRPISGNNYLSCYFGAPNRNADLPAKSAFQAMMEKSMAASETVCATDPVERDKASVPELLRFLPADVKRLPWSDIRDSLKGDRFKCSLNGDRESCWRMAMEFVVLPSGHEFNSIFEVPNGGAIIVPRTLSVYRGNWSKSKFGVCLEGEPGGEFLAFQMCLFNNCPY